MARNAAKSSWPADKVERRPVADLIPYARNARTHSDRQIEQIAASIREWGWTVPVLIDEDGGIIAGHGRILAAKLAGIEDVPCMVASGWTKAQKRAYVLADNKLAENAAWDFPMLADELKEIGAEDFDLDLVGFSELEKASLLTDFGAGGDRASSAKEIDPDGFEMAHRCPRCSFEFDD